MEAELYYGREEQYLKAITKLNWDEYSETKIILERILEDNPDYARAHFKLGYIYYTQLKDFERATYHFRLSIKFEPEFTEAYPHYLELLNTINNRKQLKVLATNALNVTGVNKSAIYLQLGLSEEQNLNFKEAKDFYHMALYNSTRKSDIEVYKDHIERLEYKLKIRQEKDVS